MGDQIALCAFHSFLVEVEMNAGYILDPSAYGSGNVRVTTYMRMRNNNPGLGLRAPLVACNNNIMYEK